jgi:peptidoglycan hydrolase CwlO-like protein
MNKDLESNSSAQAKSDAAKPMPPGLEKVRTLGAVVAILGAALGVSVGDALAARPPVVDTGDQPAADQMKLKSSQYKLDAKQQKLGSAQIKLDATQHKIDANQHKLDANQIKIGAPIGGK